MQKTKKSRMILSAVSVLVVLSLLAGMTMAWFTDTEKVNANFTAGVLDISVKPGETEMASLKFENLRPLLHENFSKELQDNGKHEWTNNVKANGMDASAYKPIPAYFKPVVITNEGTLPTKVQLSMVLDTTVNDREPILTTDNITIKQDPEKTQKCESRLKGVMKVLVYKNLSNGGWEEIGNVNLNTDSLEKNPDGTVKESSTYMTAMIPAGASARYVIAGYLPETAENEYQGQHYHGELVLKAYQMDDVDAGKPDDSSDWPISKEKLQELVDLLQGLDADDYTPLSWDAFEAELHAAEKVLANSTATADDVENAYDDLYTAVLNLVFKSDRGELDALIEKSALVEKDIEAGKYLPVGQDAFREALAEARAIDDNATQEVVDAAAKKLAIALANLRLDPSKARAATYSNSKDEDLINLKAAIIVSKYAVEDGNTNVRAMAEVFLRMVG